jgi:hypothetical protein
MNWLGSVVEAFRLARGLVISIAALWCLVPFSAQFVAHPDDVIRMQRLLEGESIPSVFSTQQFMAGRLAAVTILAALVLLLLGLLTVLYHRLQFSLTLWPIGLIFLGVIGNALWYYGFAFVDPPGIVAGLLPAGLTIIWQRAAEGWAQDFVFGRGHRPRYLGGR